MSKRAESKNFNRRLRYHLAEQKGCARLLFRDFLTFKCRTDMGWSIPTGLLIQGWFDNWMAALYHILCELVKWWKKTGWNSWTASPEIACRLLLFFICKLRVTHSQSGSTKYSLTGEKKSLPHLFQICDLDNPILHQNNYFHDPLNKGYSSLHTALWSSKTSLCKNKAQPSPWTAPADLSHIPCGINIEFTLCEHSGLSSNCPDNLPHVCILRIKIVFYWVPSFYKCFSGCSCLSQFHMWHVSCHFWWSCYW